MNLSKNNDLMKSLATNNLVVWSVGHLVL